MNDEAAAKFVLLDFELLALLALALGVGAYAILRPRRMQWMAPAGAADFDFFDLILMFFPALLFLLNPVIEAWVSMRAATEGAEAAVADKTKGGIGAILTNLGYFLFVGVMTYGLLEWVRNRRVSELFGLNRLRLAPILLYSILGGVFSVWICGVVIGDFTSRYLEGIFGKLELQEPVRLLRESNSPVYLGLSIFLACGVAPLVEEMLFRGYIYGTVRRLTHPIFAILVVGAIFAVVHGNLPALLPLWIFSILLCLAYEWSGSLWVSIGMHAFFNATNIVMMMIPLPGD